MQYQTLGRTGAKVAQIGFGGAGVGLTNYLTTWNPTAEKEVKLTEQVMERAIELGINYFDTAPFMVQRNFSDVPLNHIVSSSFLPQKSGKHMLMMSVEAWKKVLSGSKLTGLT